MKRLFVAAVMVGLAAGCASERLMYAGPIRVKSDRPPGVMLESKEKQLVECYASGGDSLSDVKTGQWAVVEGTRAPHEGNFAISLRECQVVAVAAGDTADVPGLELRRRSPTPAVERAPTTPAKK